MNATTRPPRTVILLVLAVVTSWVWLPAVVAEVLGDWTRPWFSLTWFAICAVILVAAFLRSRDEFLTWIRAPFRR